MQDGIAYFVQVVQKYEVWKVVMTGTVSDLLRGKIPDLLGNNCEVRMYETRTAVSEVSVPDDRIFATN